MPWRLPIWVCLILPLAVTLKRFLTEAFVFILGILLSIFVLTPARFAGTPHRTFEKSNGDRSIPPRFARYYDSYVRVVGIHEPTRHALPAGSDGAL